MKSTLITVCLFLLSSCISFDEVYMKDDLKKAMLTGKVITEEGLPLEGATVKLNELQEAKTDINGRFLFDFIKYGEYQVVVKKDGYSSQTTNFKYSFKTRKNNFIKVKLKSLNYLINDGIEFLKEKKYTAVQGILTQVKEIAPYDETVLYLNALYFYYGAKYEDAVKILEALRYQDRKIVYYPLVLIRCYNKLHLYLKEATLCYYVGISFGKKYIFLIKKAASIYKYNMNNIGMHDKMMAEYKSRE